MSDHNGAAPLTLALDAEALRPLVSLIVQEALAAVQAQYEAMPEKMAFSEPEAARLLSLRQHQLRDERLRGRIKASTGPGGRILYSKGDMLAYLANRRWTPA
jgi:hypothetical protein